MHDSTRLFVAAVFVAAIVALSACGSEEPDAEDLRCDDEDRAARYEPGMIEDGVDSVFKVRLVESTPAPPAKGDNTWIVDVLDYGTSAPVDGATITATPFMPDHNHGTPVQTEIAPTGAPGQFQLDRVNLWMPGLWEVRIEADANGEHDESVFPFCIEG